MCLAGSATAQGFAGLGTDASGFALPDRDHIYEFPRDHGAHPAFRIEWWYLTATLSGADGKDYGVQWTLFRSALKPEEAAGWDSPQLWMAHAAATSATGHYVDERMARGGVGGAGVTAAPFVAWIDDWAMTSTAPPDKDALSRLSLSASGTDFAYDLTLQADGPLVFHGDRGYSVKSREGQASHYYSQPHYRVTGTLELPDGPVVVEGDGWLDREWSSQPLSEDQTGWDWFSLGFDDGTKLMAFRLRDAGNGFRSGTWITRHGQALPLADEQIVVTPLAETEINGRAVPTRWHVDITSRGVSVEVAALNPQSWMDTSFPYWEGPVRISGSHSGRGYLEMTGYAPEVEESED
ncbi:MAG: lipocalin-like domain-containing protein [Pseudomonadota bacterium]